MTNYKLERLLQLYHQNMSDDFGLGLSEREEFRRIEQEIESELAQFKITETGKEILKQLYNMELSVFDIKQMQQELFQLRPIVQRLKNEIQASKLLLRDGNPLLMNATEYLQNLKLIMGEQEKKE